MVSAFDLLQRGLRTMSLRFVKQGTAGRSERGLPGESALRMTTGIERISEESYQGWQIEITHRQVGVIAPRSQFTASIRLAGMQQRMVGWRSSKRANHAVLDGAYLLSPVVI